MINKTNISVYLFLYLITFLSLIFITNISLSDGIEIEGFAKIIDGDTVKISNSIIRLSGIDAPEIKQLCTDKNLNEWHCGKKSKMALKNFINKKTIKCIGYKKDRYKRIIGECYLEEQDIQEWMVKNGWAIAYKKYSKKYINAENFAKSNNLGIWEGKFIEPYKWRKLNK